MPFVPLDPDTVAAMSMPAAVPRESASSLRQLHYNAHVDSIHWMHNELMVLRVRPAEHFPPFVPGQYAVLGLGYWEPRIQGAQSERLTPEQKSRIVKRPYSLSCRLVDNHGNIILPQ